MPPPFLFSLRLRVHSRRPPLTRPPFCFSDYDAATSRNCKYRRRWFVARVHSLILCLSQLTRVGHLYPSHPVRSRFPVSSPRSRRISDKFPSPGLFRPRRENMRRARGAVNKRVISLREIMRDSHLSKHPRQDRARNGPSPSITKW